MILRDVSLAFIGKFNLRFQIWAVKYFHVSVLPQSLSPPQSTRTTRTPLHQSGGRARRSGLRDDEFRRQSWIAPAFLSLQTFDPQTFYFPLSKLLVKLVPTSVPNISFIVFDLILLQECAVFILKSFVAMMFVLITNVCRNAFDFFLPHGKRSVPVLP